MSTPEQPKELDRRSFFKWSLLSWAGFAATLAGCGSILREKYNPAIQELKSGATILTDASLGSHCRVTVQEDFLLSNPVNALDGQRIVWEILQGPVGNHKLILDSKFILGIDITTIKHSESANKRDFLTAIYNAPMDRWHVVGFVRGYA